MKLDARTPSGPLPQKWENFKKDQKLVNPANKRKFRVLVVGTGLAGGSAAATLAELGYEVLAFCFQDSPRRAHSIAAQGGINAAKTTRTTATASGGSSTTPSRAATSAPARRTSTAWPRCR